MSRGRVTAASPPSQVSLNTITSRNNLAELYLEDSKLDAAEGLLTEALGDARQVL